MYHLALAFESNAEIEQRCRSREIDRQLRNIRIKDETKVQVICVGDVSASSLFLNQIKILKSHKSILSNRQKLKNKLEYEFVTFIQNVIKEKHECFEDISKNILEEIILWKEGEIFTPSIVNTIKTILKDSNVKKLILHNAEFNNLVTLLNSCENCLNSDYLPNNNELFYLLKKYPNLIKDKPEFSVEFKKYCPKIRFYDTACSIYFNNKRFYHYLPGDSIIVWFIPLTDYKVENNKLLKYINDFNEFSKSLKNYHLEYAKKLIIFTNLREFEITIDEDFKNYFTNCISTDFSSEEIRSFISGQFKDVDHIYFFEENDPENAKFFCEKMCSNLTDIRESFIICRYPGDFAI